MSIAERTAAVENAKASVKAHCMCAKFEDDGRRFTIIYPEGDFSVHGARCDYSAHGKLWALNKLLEIIEREWKASFF